MQRPLPPFRAQPSRRAIAPKPSADARRETVVEISIKARRHPVKLARLNATPSRKVLSPLA